MSLKQEEIYALSFEVEREIRYSQSHKSCKTVIRKEERTENQGLKIGHKTSFVGFIQMFFDGDKATLNTTTLITFQVHVTILSDLM